MKQLKFTENLNCKLQCNFFTTIRKHSDSFVVNDEVMCHMTKQVRVEFKAIIVAKYTRKFDKIMPSVLSCDTGYSYESAVELFKKIYGNDLCNIDFDIITLQKTSKFYVK